MKIKILATALCALALGFTACDDDDDDAILSTHPEKEIAGKSFDGKFQQVNNTTKDTTYVDGSLAFEATDTAYVCKVTATVGEDAYSYKANVIRTSNGFSFYCYPEDAGDVSPIGNDGFLGTLSNSDDAMLYFERSKRSGKRTVIFKFTFSNTKWK